MCGRRAWLKFNLGVESSIDRGSGQSRILSLPTWAGISTLAVAPGCCGFSGPVPSATLDKRCRLQQRTQNSKIERPVKRRIRPQDKIMGNPRRDTARCAHFRRSIRASGRRCCLRLDLKAPLNLPKRTGGNSLAASRIIAIDSRLPHCSN